MHERLSFDVVRFLIALLDAQCIRQELAGLLLGGTIAAGERKGFVATAFRLVSVAFRETQPAALDPEQRVVGFDSQRAVERRGRSIQIAMRHQASRLRHEGTGGGREMILAWRLRGSRGRWRGRL